MRVGISPRKIEMLKVKEERMAAGQTRHPQCEVSRGLAWILWAQGSVGHTLPPRAYLQAGTPS